LKLQFFTSYVSELNTSYFVQGQIIVCGVPRWGLDRICEFLALTHSLTQNVTHGSILERFCGRLQTEFLWLSECNTGGWGFVSMPINFVLLKFASPCIITQFH